MCNNTTMKRRSTYPAASASSQTVIPGLEKRPQRQPASAPMSRLATGGVGGYAEDIQRQYRAQRRQKILTLFLAVVIPLTFLVLLFAAPAGGGGNFSFLRQSATKSAAVDSASSILTSAAAPPPPVPVPVPTSSDKTALHKIGIFLGLRTESPTSYPTAMPTTAKPTTATPTATPTMTPTDSPTDVPTETPTSAPTVAPTDAPTSSPTLLSTTIKGDSIPDKPKAYIHVGAPKTGTTSIQDTMAMDKKVLEEDKFFLALHGQIRTEDDQDYIIDNMLVLCDPLGACIWSDIERTNVKAADHDAGTCPDYLLPAFDKFQLKALAAKSNIVISNEWLNRPSSEVGLLNILGVWDPTIVIYYRRYFDWMISAHYQWHNDIRIDTMESLQGRVRLIDFIRTFCARLFSSKKSDSPNDVHIDYADLTDIQEYTYHIWKRYNNVPRFQDSIKIVNFHDGHIIKAFYCDVLSANNACKLETERLTSGGSINTRSKSSTLYVDLAIGVHWMNKTMLGEYENEPLDPLTMNTFFEEGEKFRKQMEANGFVEDDLPKECLTEEELTLLLDVSLAYENILLPDTYATGGNDATREHFAQTLAANKFCSVDTKAVLMDPKWKFLLEKSVADE